MALISYPVAGKLKAKILCDAFVEGAPRDAKGHVFFGVKDDNVRAWRKAIASSDPVYLIDNSYFDCVRETQFRVTKNAIQLPGARLHQSDGRRFAALGQTIKPWRVQPGGYWLVVEQSEVFMRLTAQQPKWLEDTLASITSDRPMKVRRWSNNKMKLQTTLKADLIGTWTLITHTTSAAVTAAMEGVPIIVSEMHALAGMVCSQDPALDERKHFLNVLADNQFSIDEMRQGKAWAWLNRNK